MNVLLLFNSSAGQPEICRTHLVHYLDHFGFPYTAIDIAKEKLPGDLAGYAMIIIGHGDFLSGKSISYDTLWTFLEKCLDKGIGVVSFDPSIPKPKDINQPEAQKSSGSASSVAFINTDHFITQWHSEKKPIQLFGEMAVPFMSADEGDVLATAGNWPLIAASHYGNGKLVRWATMAWMHTSVLGPVAGMDDMLWRSLVWSAAKPFAMRGLQPLVTMRVDDVSGTGALWKKKPLYWVDICNRYGFKPWLGLFIYNLTPECVGDLRKLISDGNATGFPHAFGRPPRDKDTESFYWHPKAITFRADSYDEFIYFDHNHQKPWTDEEAVRGLQAVDAWYGEAKLPISNYACCHWYEVGDNCIPHIINKWKSEFTGLPRDTNLPYINTIPWLKAGPFRKHEKPGMCMQNQGQEGELPVCYADFVDTAGLRMFNCLTEIRDDAGYEWAPDNDMLDSINRGVRQLRRALSGMALSVLFTHETDYIYKIEPDKWEHEIAGISDRIEDFKPRYMTTDEAIRIVRAHRTSRLESCIFDPSGRSITASLSGNTDIPTTFYLFTEKNGVIDSRLVDVPVFKDTANIRVTI